MLLKNLVIEEYEEDNDEWVDNEEIEEDIEELPPADIEGIKKEISELEQFRDLAEKIKKNSKAEHLFVALDKGFEQLKHLGAASKALILRSQNVRKSFFMDISKRGDIRVRLFDLTGLIPIKNRRLFIRHG